MKKLSRALKLIEKFAKIPIYPKCQICGDADPNADPENPYCYKHSGIDEMVEYEKIKEKNYDVNTNLLPDIEKRHLITRLETSPTDIIRNLKRQNKFVFKPFRVKNFFITIIAGDRKDCCSIPQAYTPDLYKYKAVSGNAETMDGTDLLDILRSFRWMNNKSWVKYFSSPKKFEYMPLSELEQMIKDLQEFES